MVCQGPSQDHLLCGPLAIIHCQISEGYQFLVGLVVSCGKFAKDAVNGVENDAADVLAVSFGSLC